MARLGSPSDARSKFRSPTALQRTLEETMAERFVIKKTKNGQCVFVLKAANGEDIATSETYNSSASAQAGIASVKANAATARVDDETRE
jgi:uncharacterized protein YegP (UPF0339 family)